MAKAYPYAGHKWNEAIEHAEISFRVTFGDRLKLISDLSATPQPVDAPYLLIDGRDSGLTGGAIALPPCPVIAVGPGPAGDLADCRVPSTKEVDRLVVAITAHRVAASVLVALLRQLPGMTIEQGLIAESLAYGHLQGGADHASWLALQQPQSVAPAGQVHIARDEGRLDILMDRPAADNAIDRPMRDGLAEAFQLAVIDETITAVKLRGAGRSFSLGAELSEFGTTRDPAEAHRIRQLTLPAIWAAQCGDKLEVHVQGACVGAGLEIAAFSRRITAGPRAWFQLPELAMGLIPGAGGCVSLTRRIGRQRTAELVLSGRRLSVREALDWGLVDALVDDPARDEGGSNML